MLMFLHRNMRIKNKYLRNRHARNKAWNRAKKIVGGEFSQKFSNPYWFHGKKYATVDEQLRDHQTWISEWWVRGFLSGQKEGRCNSPQWYRQIIERRERRLVKIALDRMLKDVNNVDDYDIPCYNHDANWDWI